MRAFIVLCVLLASIESLGAFPSGIYVRSKARTLASDCGIGEIQWQDFLDGLVWLVRWDDLEPSPDAFRYLDCLDKVVAMVQKAGKRLVLNLNAPEPPWLAQKDGIQTYSDPEHGKRVVPWEPFGHARYARLMAALANHEVADASLGKAVPLKQHPALVAVRAYVPVGVGRIRDGVEKGPRFSQMPGYSLEKLIEAITLDLSLTQQAFGKPMRIGFWPVMHWQAIREAILRQFPDVAFSQDNLAASRPKSNLESITIRPNPQLGAPLIGHQFNTFEPLHAWRKGDEKMANGEPADGIACAFKAYGARFFQLYADDVAHQPYQAGLRRWALFFRGEAPMPPLPMCEGPERRHKASRVPSR